MRNVIIIFLGVLFSQIAHAQDSIIFPVKKSEINIGYLNILSLGSTHDFGVGYKLKIGNGALRARSDFNYSNSTNKSSNDTSENVSKSFFPRIGYEFRLNYKRSVVFYGLDICASFNHSEENSSNNNYLYSNTTNGIGLSPFIGFKYFINKNISISTETSFDFLYTKTNYKNSYNGVTSYENNRETITARLSPLGIFSINFHF